MAVGATLGTTVTANCLAALRQQIIAGRRLAGRAHSALFNLVTALGLALAICEPDPAHG